MRVAAVTGLSGSGKTTLLESLIRRYVALGLRVAAIKHTHHAVNEGEGGDTGRFRACGADPVIFAGSGEAILFPSRRRVCFVIPAELLEHAGSADVVLVEGFRSFTGWPQIRLSAGSWLTEEEAATMLDRIWNRS